MVEILDVRNVEDGVINLSDAPTPTWFAVRFRGRVCSPRWNMPGPADAYYKSLVAGTREPEYGNPLA